MTFSILILTLNEQNNIRECIQSVRWADDIVILDSYSKDQTCEIARECGARVYQRKFDNFADQRNYALDEIEFKHRCVFHLDADERFNEALKLECMRVIEEEPFSAWFVPNRIIFLGRWIKHSSQYPFSQVRLLRLGEVRFEKAGHGQKEFRPKNGTGRILTPYDHFNFSKGVSDWFAKHNIYADAEAEIKPKENINLNEIVSFDKITRKRALKSIFRSLPFQPHIKFIYLYIFCLGVLDGKPGYLYCRMIFVYELIVQIKASVAKIDRNAI